MDIMMRLKGAGFSVIANEFRQREKRLGGGLPLQDFVEIVLSGLPKPRSAEEKYANVNALVDLFDDIDINGDGAMEFEEFTSYCVDAGMAATCTKSVAMKTRYVRDTKHVIKTEKGCAGIDKIKWSPQFQRFLVLDNSATSVKLFNADGKLVADVAAQYALQTAIPDSPRMVDRALGLEGAGSSGSGSGAGVNGSGVTGSPLDGEEHTRKKQIANQILSAQSNDPAGASTSSAARAPTSNAGTDMFILDAAFLYKYQCLALSTTDFVISFYSLEEPKHQGPGSALASKAVGPSYALLRKLTITTTTAQLLMRFCEEAGLLLTTGNDFVINVWKFVDQDTKMLWKQLLIHQDMILDLIEIPMHDLIVSCDMNCTIQLWDIHDCRSRGALLGHTHGIKQIVYAQDSDLLLSAGFEFDAYAWDLASRQVVLKMVGHRAPLIGVQLVMFQTERAITADSSGVFKLWDISRGSAVGAGGANHSGSGGHGRGASHAIQLESIDPSQSLSRFEPTTFMSLFPLRRDVWAAASGSATLHCFRSTRVQKFDEIPLNAFYHYNANRFVVVCGPICSIWDGDTGVCLDEFSHVGEGVGRGNGRHKARGDGGANGGNQTSSNKHNGMDVPAGMEPSTDILLSTQDAKCKKLVVLSEEGEMGVFNCQNFVQMRRCQEQFRGVNGSTTAASSGVVGRPRASTSLSCGIVGMHYCSANKIVILTDAHTRSIIVVDDSNTDSAKGVVETKVLRRLMHIPAGITASAYSYHASIIATMGEKGDSGEAPAISLWDFETLAFLSSCKLAEGNQNNSEVKSDYTLGVLEFWDEYPVLLGADLHGGVYFFAVMPTRCANTGKLLHAFVNDHQDTRIAQLDDTTSPDGNDTKDVGDGIHYEPALNSVRKLNEIHQGDDLSTTSSTFITEPAEHVARQLLLRRMKRHQEKQEDATIASTNAQQQTPSSVNKIPTNPTEAEMGGVVTCMRVVLDDESNRYLLFTGDERGVIRVWDLSQTMRRLSLFKIPETQCKYLRRGYHPRAMFTHDCAKESAAKRGHATAHNSNASTSSSLHSSSTSWRQSLLQADTPAHIVPTQNDLKKLSKQRLDAKKRASSRSSSAAALAKFLPPNRVEPDQVAPPTEGALNAAEAFLSAGPRRKSGRTSSTLQGTLVLPRSTAPLNGRRISQCWEHKDVTIAYVWTAHQDGITSLAVTAHPNIVVTCSLDMRVYVWNWQGACLGKLFDTESVRVPGYRWRFVKDDTKRQMERHNLVQELLGELDLTPQQKATQRRQTVYENHVARKSHHDLHHVNLMLLDHLVSQNPEVAAMEKDGLLHDLDDEHMNNQLEKKRTRNHQAKTQMLCGLRRISEGNIAVPPDSVSLSERTDKNHKGEDFTSADVDENKRSDQILSERSFSQKEILRARSLAQVGPLLCVNKFEFQQEEAAMKFTEQDELKMDRRYLEHELAIALPQSSISPPSNAKVPRTSAKPGALSDIAAQIRHTQQDAEEKLANKIALQRHAMAMYTNLQLATPKQGRSSVHEAQLLSVQTGLDSVNNSRNNSTPQDLEPLLRPSAFLQKHLSERTLSIRPNTAPSPRGIHHLKASRNTKGKIKSGNTLPECKDVVSVENTTTLTRSSLNPQDKSRLPRQPNLDRLKGSASESALPCVVSHMPVSSECVPIPSSATDHRRCSLDRVYMEQLMRQGILKGNRKKSQDKLVATLSVSTLGRNGSIGQLQDVPPIAQSATKKLDTINDIIDKAHDYGRRFASSPLSPESKRPLTAPTSHARQVTTIPTIPSSMGANLPVLREYEEAGEGFDLTRNTEDELNGACPNNTIYEDELRAHLEATRQRMETMASENSERDGPSHRSIINRRRHEVERSKKTKRMEDYLQQKRREMNTNIGSVFKRTSFAFQSGPSGSKPGSRSSHGHKASTLEKNKVFGIYGVKEVMSVIRLFWAMDEDGSGQLTLPELLAYKSVFEKLGYHDMATVFQAIDKDGNGHITLRELLEVCFLYATPIQLDEMLVLAKMHGNVRALPRDGDDGETGDRERAYRSAEQSLSPEHRAEFMAIFRVFDKDGDGGVSIDEIMEALRVDDSEESVAQLMGSSKVQEQSLSSDEITSTTKLKTRGASRAASGLTPADIRQLYAEFDADGNRTLDFNEFVALMLSLEGPRSTGPY